MSYTDDFWKALEEEQKKKKKKNSSVTQSPASSGDSYSDEFYNEMQSLQKKTGEIDDSFLPTVGRFSDDDIAPVKDDSALDFFDAGSFDDGYQLWDVSKAILGTAGDAVTGAAKGLFGFAEGIADTIGYGVYGIRKAFGEDERSLERYKQDIAESTADKVFGGAEEYLDQYSVLGSTSNAITQGIGQVGAMVATGGVLGGAAGLGTAGTTIATNGMLGLSSLGSGMSEAYMGGATDGEALGYGAMSAASEVAFESIFGGMGKAINAVGFNKGLLPLDDMTAKAVSKFVKSQTGKNIVEGLVKGGFEGLEELGTGIAQGTAKWLTYKSEEDFGKILEDENLFEQFVVGMITSDITQAGDVNNAIKSGRDFVTGNTQNEQTVLDKLVEDRIAEAEKNGEKLSGKDKNKILEDVTREMERGYISTDTIEEILGGDSYKSYKDTIAKEDAIKKEFDELKNKQGATLEEQARFREVRREYNRNQSEQGKARRTELKNKMSQDVFNKVKNDRLAESYLERARVGEDFQADLTKYKGTKHEDAAKKTLENAIKAGANNTNRVHDLVDMAADLSSETGYVYDFKDNEQIKSDFIERKTSELAKLEAIENPTAEQSEKIAKLKDLITKVQNNEVTVNGNVDSNGIVLNLDSAKPLNRIIGHEITHTVEKAKHYEKLRDSLFAYAKSKGVDIDAELEMKALEYEGVEGTTAEAELVADLVGDYLFSDSDYVRTLSTENRNLAQRIYDEVKYFLTKVTKGSKEERELLKVKHEFEKAFRESAEISEMADTETKHSLRTNPPPKETGVAYKVFFVKDGKLYPPMVANPEGADTPMGVWLDADVGTSAPPSKTGRAQVKAGGKGTQGGGGSLAFRPGWHLGDLPRASQFDRVNPETGKKELFPENFVWAEVEYAKDVDYQEEAMSYGYTDNGKFRHAYAGLPRLPENGYYRYRTNPKPDTVPWIITGAMKVNRLLSDAEVNQILEKNGVAPVHRQGGDVGLDKFGFDDSGAVKYSLSANAKTDVHSALVDKNYAGEVKLTDTSPSILLSQKGVRNLPMVMNASHIRENIFTEEEAKSNGLRVSPNINYHGLGEDLFLKVIDDLDNVREAYRGTKNADDPDRRENYFLLISQQTDKDGNIINVPVYINEKGVYNRVFIDTNKIATVFGRSELREYTKRQINQGNLVRIKNRSTQASESTSPIKADYGMDASCADNVAQVPDNVKTQYSLSNNQRKSLYTGSPVTDIKQFKVGGANGVKQTGDRYGRGIYLTTNKTTAQGYAGDSGRVYEINADDLNIFDLNDSITEEMKATLARELNGKDKQFRNSILRNFRSEKAFTDFESAEKFFDEQRKVWKKEDGYYSANKPEILSADAKTGNAVIEYTDFVNIDNAIGNLTGNQLYDALKSISTDDFALFITGHGFDGIAFDEDTDNQQYVIYRNEDRLHIMNDGDVAPTKYSLSDSTYLDAVNRGDTETAQKMVDEAAKNAGYDIKAYHGTRHGGFTVFDDTKNDLAQKGFFFSDSPEVAKSYFKGADGTLYSEYIRMDNPLIIDGHRRNWDALKFDVGDDAQAYKIEQRKDGRWEIFNIEGRVNISRQVAWDTKEDAEQAYRSATWVHPTSTVLNTTRAIVRYAYNKGDYDGVVIKNTIDMGDSRAKRRISTLYIPFKSEQIKTTDPVTYDDNGNVIPLSQRFNTENDDIRFSLSKAVEETKDLIALHNLTADKLTKSLELGGLPMPSLAVTKADIPHSNFGEITLVFGKETIDPKANKKNKTYSADAWTPTFPSVEYEADSKVVRRASQKLRELGGKIGEEFQRDLSRIGYSIEDYLNRQGGEEGLVQYVMDNYGLKAAYLEDIGKHIEPVTKQEEVPRNFNPNLADKYTKVMDILGVTTAEEVWDFNLKEARDNHGTELEEVFPGVTQSGLRMGKMLGSVASYLKGKDSAPEYKTVTDSAATRKAVDDAIDAEGFESWTRNLFAGVEKDSGIYNNKDLFTPSGNRRSFKQTHLPVTLENIVKAMASQNNGNSKNVSGFNGIKTLRAAAAETFKSIDDMHNRKDRLQHLTQEQADEITDNLQHRLSNIIDAIDNENAQKGDRNPYIRYDQIGDVLSEIGEGGKYNVADIQRVFSEYGRTVSDDTAQDVKQLLYDVTQMPVNIFEAKPERVVGFDEAKVFVIPRNADVKLKQELLNRGYSIAEYDPDVEGDRQKVVNQFEEYKFSLSDTGKEFAPIGSNEIYGKDFRKKSADEIAAEEDIAPIAEAVDTSVKNVEADTDNGRENVVDEHPVAETVDAESLAGDRDSFMSQKAMELYKEITSLKKGVRASQRLGYLLDHGHEWKSIKTALLNIRDNPNQVVNPNSQAESVAREMLGREYDDMVEELAEPSDVAGKIRAKMQHIQTEIANNQRLREQSNADYDTEIADVQAEYDAKKNKNTVTANNLLRRIERLKRLKGTNEAHYTKRISDLEARIEKMSKPEYKRAVQRKAKHEEYTKLMENLVGDTSTWVDKKLGISYKVNTLRRNLRDVVRDANGKQDIAKADAIYDELQGKYNHNEAELKRESRRIKAVFAEMNLNHAEDTYAHMLGEFQSNPDSKLTEETVKEFYEKNKGKIDTKKVDKAIEEARKTFDELIVRVNERLKEQGMKEIPYRKGYFPHFTNPKQGWLAKLLNWKTVDTEIPTSIAGLTETFNPERSWQGFSKQRKADTTDYSLEQGLDTYIHGALDWIYHIEDIQKRRALENHIRYIHSEEGVKAKVDAIRNSEELDADEAQQQIDAVYAQANNPLNNFVTNLRAGTNTLANKKSENDRQWEINTSRKVYSVMTNLNNRINANMVVGSFSSALTNFIPITQSWMEVSPVYSLRGMKDTIKSTIRDDGVVSKSDFLTNRLLNEENLYQTTWDKVSDKAALMMEAIDSFTSQTVWRSKYLQNISEGMSETEAIKNADQFAENVIAGRSRGNMPTIFDAKNPFTKLFTAFQLEVSNQYGYMFKDAPQDSKNKARLIKGYATAFLGAYVYNALYSSLVGRDAAFDPIGILEDLFRDMGLFGDDEEEEKEDILLNLRDNILEEVPFVGSLMGGGRIPISSALPYSGEYEGLEAFLTDVSEGNDEKIWKEVFSSLSYLALPVGGGQIKKTVEGLSMFSDEHPVAGSYTDSGNLRFPVEDTFGNRLQAGLFGQYASQNARDYFDNGRSPLKEKQIQEYMDVDIPIRDYWEYREGLAEQKTVEDKFDYIAGLDLPVAKKNILINNVVDREESVDLEGYEDFSGYEEFDFATKNPGKYAVSQAVGGFDAYSSYMDALDDIESDKDENGKSISGSKKEKVFNYIESLPIDAGMKMILYKSMYDSKEDRTAYNAKIVEYLDSREDISYDDMVTILTELGMRVSGNNVYWD